MNYYFKKLFILSLTLIVLCCIATESYALDPTFNRNGEVYLSITGAPAASGIINGIYRLNDPEGALSGSYPQYLFTENNIQTFAVDINRNIFTLSDPDVSTIGSSYKLKRQVLDNTTALQMSTNEGKYPKTGVTDEYPAEFSHKVTELQSDWGAHAYIHHDNRTTYGGAGAGTDIYRTVTNPGDGTVKRGVRGHYSSSNPWPKFKALQGTPTTAPANPKEYLPNYANVNQALVLPHYPGKKWYEIPNGAWFSSWRLRKGDGGSSPFPGGRYYYQCFRDYATGQQFDWRMVEHNPKTVKASSYTRKANAPFATTYKMSLTRGVIAGCLDGCGGSQAKPGTTSSSDMIFHAAFMPYSDKGNPAVTIYSYTRTDGTANFGLDWQKGSRSASYVTFGSGSGVGKNDTKWIGVSKGPTQTGGAERDYVYYLGTSQIQSWIPGIKNQNITAVSVSNQWNEEGGIIFAFNQKDNQIIKFTLKPSSTNTAGQLDKYTTIDVSTLLSKMNANSSIDDIAADGFGNLYLSLTYPSANPNFDIPKAFKWTYDDAISYERTDSASAGSSLFTFRFAMDYRKSVWKVSSVGQPLEEVGAAKMARRYYYRNVTFPLAKASLIPPSSTFPTKVDAIVNANKMWEGSFAPESLTPVTAASKLAIINAPTPPEVLSLGGNNSYIDIIGPYADTIPTPDVLNYSTNQNSQARVSGNLQLSTVYFYMVENYPIPEAQQDPNVNADYDGDGRRSGFVSTIINPDPTKGSMRYYWNIYGVRDFKGDPYYNDAGQIVPNEMNTSNNFFTVFYTPVPGKYIVTCKASYDWYDYDTVKFGQTIKEWKDNLSTNGGKKTSWAQPSGIGLNAAGNPNIENPTTRLTNVLNSLFSDYKGDKTAAVTSIRNKIMDESNSSFIAIEGITASGTPPEISTEGATEIARVQRCNPPSTKVTTHANWHPQGSGQMTPAAGYHGLNSESAYYWRIDVASQSIFYDDLSVTKHYNFIANKLTNPADKAYYVNSKSDLRFLKNGSDLKWDKAEAELEASLEYPTLDINNKEVTKSFPLETLKQYVVDKTNGNFIYFQLPAGTLPPTDPYVGKLKIKITRMFHYDMYVFDNKGNQLMSTPITLPKQLTITGEAAVMVMDSQQPSIVFNETSPNQLYGETGQLLTQAGNGSKLTAIAISMRDNNAWETKTSLSKHKDYNASNIAYNKDRIAKINTENASFNLKPVFNNDNRYLKVSYNIPSSTGSGVTKNPFVPAWGKSLTGITLKTTSLHEDATAFGKLYAKLNLELPLNKLNNTSGITLPANYANNTPSYAPLKFFISASDSSGNEMPERELNVILHIKDTIAPVPFGQIEELKSNGISYFPSMSTNTSTGAAWFADFKTGVREAVNNYNTATVWTANASTGKIGNYGAKELFALPYLNGDGNNIISLTKVPFNTALNTSAFPPGNIQVEDNVEVVIRAGATDNAGAAMPKLTYKYYDISGLEQTTTVNYPTSWSHPGVSYDSTAQTVIGSRIIFREGGDKAEKFPLGIPIIIEAKDDAREWDSYKSAKHNADSFTWGTLTQGTIKSLTRTLKTTLPVYGTRLDIRTIDRYLQPK